MDKYDARRKLESLGNISGEVWVTSLAVGSTAVAAYFVACKYYKLHKQAQQEKTPNAEITQLLGKDDIERGK